MSKMLIFSFLKRLIPKNKKGGPILEEILLIGIAVIIILIIMGIIFGLIDWTNKSIFDVFGR